jgi:hypothetical protein
MLGFIGIYISKYRLQTPGQTQEERKEEFHQLNLYVYLNKKHCKWYKLLAL